jgi:hypothetical protein
MYWTRTESLTGLLAWLLLSLLWSAGGWLLAMHVFRLRRGESLVAGLASGLLLFIVFANLLGQVLPLEAAFWIAAASILALGLLSAWREADWLSLWKEELKAWPQILALAGLTALFAMINHGLAIFDDYHNLPLVSVIAAGDLPPHFYLNPGQRLAYHYGLHVFAASLMRVGDFFPWSAFDLSKAVTFSLAVSLAWLWFRRVTRSRLGAGLGSILALLGGGARWLLLFVPAAYLIRWGAGLHMLGSANATAPDLYAALASPWKIEGGGPLPFPFAFANGIFPSLLMSMGGPGALPQMTVLLLLLVDQRRWRLSSAALYGLLLGSLALTGEHLFGMVWVGTLLAAGLGYVFWGRPLGRAAILSIQKERQLYEQARRIAALRGVATGEGKKYRNPWRESLPWVTALLLSGMLALLQGGVITEIAAGGLGLTSQAASGETAGFAGFALRWPPALLSAHLGELSLTNPAQLLIGLAELGPAVLLFPWVAIWLLKGLRQDRWATSGLLIGSVVGFLLPLVLSYGVERDISRFTGSALFVWMLVGFAALWFSFRRARRPGQPLIAAAYTAAILGGAAMLAVELIAVPHPQFTYFVQEPDAMMSLAFWDQLDPDAQVLDPNLPFRAVTLFGREGGRSHRDLFTALPEWEALFTSFDPVEFARAGYSYVYLDRDTWQILSPEQKLLLQNPCARRLAEKRSDLEGYRWLLDIRGCR